MNDWKSCQNCSQQNCKWHHIFPFYCGSWKPIPCKYCGGPLSEIREYRVGKYKLKLYRHCYSCHFEFFEGERMSFKNEDE